MKNVSFGKEEDCPVPKKSTNDFNDEELDLEDDNSFVKGNKNANSSSNKKEKTSKEKNEDELSPNDPKNKKVIFSSESEDNDSDKSIEDNEKNDKNENNLKKNKIKEESDDVLKKKTKDKEIENLLLNSIKNKENATSERIQMAEEINFKAIPDKIIATDQYGFLISENNERQDSDQISNKGTFNERTKSGAELLQINARMEKWNYMIQHFDEFKTKNFSKLKSRTRKGIPDSVRSYVWQLFGEKDKYYEKDLFNKLESINLDEETEIVIIKDLDRTFPACQFFKEKYGNGQRKLFKVLSYYSKYNKDTGYVQGMGFIVAVFLTYMDEESSFFMLHSLMKKYDMEGFYLPGFPILKKTFYILLNLEKKFIPKIYELFQKEGMIPSMYASEWFICLFSRNLEFNVLVRIFDVFLLEGYKVIYRFALAFLKLKEEKFLEGKDGLASIMQTINECTENVDVEKMFNIAFGFSISRKYIDKLGNEYDKIKDDEKNEFVKQL